MPSEQFYRDQFRSQDRKTAGARRLATLDPVYHDPVAVHLNLSRAIAIWPMSSLSPDAATVRDVAGAGLHLTNNNAAAFQFTGLAPYASFTAASSQYLSRTHGSDIAATGSQWWSTWVYPTSSPASTQGVISKFVASTNNRSWRLIKDASDQLVFQVSTLGTAIDASVTGAVVALNAWYHVFGLYIASSSLSIWVNGAVTTSTTTIPAALYNATGADLEIGRSNAGGYFDGQIGITAFGRAVGTLANWDVVAKHVYNATKWQYGV